MTASKPRKRGRKPATYAVYKGDEFLVVGTAAECAAYMGWSSPKRTQIMVSPSFKNRASKHKNHGSRMEVIRVQHDLGQEEAMMTEIQVAEQPQAVRGRLMKTIAVYSPGRRGRMKHEVGFVVSRTRPFRDVEQITEHEEVCKKARLSRYGQSLFDSCFKNW
ncbi:hypothetical protein OXB_2861 [Bacillus sp. OxB-1]|uniref:hypothetical protein n=1 Tax=Bacillus sp. (strain OxB-1) TaxID=98228 RepID=UPI000581BBC7|nr:hypothetical protein [Bacillus sp. OxB-1]BAQ11332.1 hypothetical protein OXB_2861 [Bacillus sp. OxB-1]